MPTLLIRKGSQGRINKCGPYCYNDTSEKCTCICKGSNHGQGYDRALHNSLNHIARLRKDNPDIQLSLHSKRARGKLNQKEIDFSNE